MEDGKGITISSEGNIEMLANNIVLFATEQVRMTAGKKIEMISGGSSIIIDGEDNRIDEKAGDIYLESPLNEETPVLTEDEVSQILSEAGYAREQMVIEYTPDGIPITPENKFDEDIYDYLYHYWKEHSGEYDPKGNVVAANHISLKYKTENELKFEKWAMREFGMTNEEQTEHTLPGLLSSVLEISNVIDVILLPVSLFSAGAKFVGKEALKEGGEELAEAAGKQLLKMEGKEALQEAVEKGTKELAQVTTEKAMKEAAVMATEKSAKELAYKTGEKLTKTTKEVIDTTKENVAKAIVKKVTEKETFISVSGAKQTALSVQNTLVKQKRKYTESQIKNIIEELQGNGFKSNPLRQSYEKEVADLVNLKDSLLKQNLSTEEIARILNKTRRDLGIKYKEATPQPLRDYIYAVNQNRYGDPLGPTVDLLISRGKTFEQIIESSSRPNADINKLLSGFEEWLRRQ